MQEVERPGSRDGSIKPSPHALATRSRVSYVDSNWDLFLLKLHGVDFDNTHEFAIELRSQELHDLSQPGAENT